MQVDTFELLDRHAHERVMRARAPRDRVLRHGHRSAAHARARACGRERSLPAHQPTSACAPEARETHLASSGWRGTKSGSFSSSKLNVRYLPSRAQQGTARAARRRGRRRSRERARACVQATLPGRAVHRHHGGAWTGSRADWGQSATSQAAMAGLARAIEEARHSRAPRRRSVGLT
jgi:hypothetical protein